MARKESGLVWNLSLSHASLLGLYPESGLLMGEPLFSSPCDDFGDSVFASTDAGRV